MAPAPHTSAPGTATTATSEREDAFFRTPVMLELRRTVKLNSTVYVHQRVYEAVRRLIVEGQLAPGDKLPAHAQIAAYLHVGSPTVKRALRRLADEGLLVGVPSHGTFVL
jgi:DNA-binding GntR family transcriptional regulator